MSVPAHKPQVTRCLRSTVFALVLSAGCAFDFEPCAADTDCPPETKCMRPARTSAPMCIAPDPVAPDAGATDDAARQTHDAAPDDDPRPNGANQATACTLGQDCGAAEPNDSEETAIYLSEYAQGCGSPRFDPWAALHQDRLCAGDVDQFIVDYVPCDEGSFRLTVSLTVPAMCPAPGALEIVEGLYDCGDDNVRCEVEDGVHRVVVIIGPQPRPQPVEQMRFAVSSGLDGEGADYILRATISR